MKKSFACHFLRSAPITYWISVLLTALVFTTSATAASGETPSRIWIDRPWEFRYIMRIESPDDYLLSNRLGKKWLVEGKQNEEQELESIFPLTTSITTNPEYYRGVDKAIGTMHITFDESGEVISPNDWPHKLTAHLNHIYNLVLTSGNGPQDMLFRIGKWYTGHSDAEIEYIPAICTLDDYDRRYKKGYAADELDRVGNFGCREWGYYLQNNKIPYIDVTSYGKDKSTYIRPVIGWGRFDVPPKPVIGKHGKVWVCLHECPNGEAPGIIPDITAWAKKNGWSVPKRPKKQPMFPDRELKSGGFVD